MRAQLAPGARAPTIRDAVLKNADSPFFYGNRKAAGPPEIGRRSGASTINSGRRPARGSPRISGSVSGQSPPGEAGGGGGKRGAAKLMALFIGTAPEIPKPECPSPLKFPGEIENPPVASESADLRADRHRKLGPAWPGRTARPNPGEPAFFGPGANCPEPKKTPPRKRPLSRRMRPSRCHPCCDEKATSPARAQAPGTWPPTGQRRRSLASSCADLGPVAGESWLRPR